MATTTLSRLEARTTPPQAPRGQSAARWLPPRGVALRLFVTCWLVYGLHFTTNTVREVYLALSLGDRLSFDVSEYHDLHPDIFAIPGRGAFINNNPGTSMLGAVPYALARPLVDRVVARVQQARVMEPEASRRYDTIYPMAREFYRQARERGLDVKFGLAAGIMQGLLMAPLSALSAVVMFYLLLSMKLSVRVALALALLYAFATPVFFRTGQLNQNLLVGHLTFFTFALLWRPWDSPSRPRRPWYLLAGVLCGWTLVLDYTGLLVLVVLSFYGLWRRAALPAELKSAADPLQFTVGVVASVAVLLVYQWLCFGSPFYPAQSYMPAATFTHHGYRGMDWPQLDLLWETAFGMRFGLFTSAPLLLLAFYVPGWAHGRKRLLVGHEMWCAVAFIVLFFVFCAANQYGRMQFNSGVRHIVPVTPFLFLLAGSVLLRLPATLAVLVGLITTYWSWCLAMYRDVEQGFGVFESLLHITLEGFRLPWMTTLERMGYFPQGTSVVPLFVLSAAILWGLWTVGETAPLRPQPARHDAGLVDEHR